ncbi:hypothetical protein [Methylobacterium indicum]|uniref:Uncharacterized protein n=1 Tax=Methylobacterium indicum TaxID=1775910 RepID=A0A8H8X0R9_9HYPH|nr:hypothetical protein [Methylobacterium indicum]BCM88106.1 hypothetical protein mvi_65670 [Methylobacterium indicum]
MNLGYARTSPMRLCLLYLEQAALEASRARQNPQRWFFAAPEMHRALNCALVAALSGSEGIGAYPEKARKKWIDHFDKENWPDIPCPSEDRVESFTALLKRAQNPSDPWMSGHPIRLTESQRADLAALTELRDDMEHVKPRGWSIEVAGLPRMLAAAADAIEQILQEPRCRTELDEEDEGRAERAITCIRDLASSAGNEV